MISKVFFILFYPWVRATLNVSYNLYLEEHFKGYISSNFRFSETDVVRRFMSYHVDDYMKKAFRQHWIRIIFAPHTIITYPELYEYRFSY